MCGPELCKKVKATKKKADLEGTKTKRETRQEPTSQASELEGTITDNKRSTSVIREPNCKGLWTHKNLCGPELCKMVKATTKMDLERTKTRRELWQESTSQASELEGTINDIKETKQ